jgi:hypothetical protein
MLRLLPSSTNGLCQIFLGDRFATGKVSSRDLCVYFDTRVWWDEMVWDIVAFFNWDAGRDDGVVFPVLYC